jgi:hypothetical protein
MMKLRVLSEILVIAVVAATTACGGAQNSSTTATNTAPAASPTSQPSPLTGFEKDLQFIRNGGFTYVWLISRKDGKALDREDNVFLKANAPQVVDWVMTDGGKKVFAGTNFNLEEGNLDKLQTRYITEDYSNK